MRHCLTLFLILFLGIVWADPTQTEEHKDWFSLIIEDGDRLYFRATTGKLQKGIMGGLIIDSPMENCDSAVLKVTLGMRGPSDTTMLEEKLLAQMRVDSAPIRNLIYAMSLLEGDDTAYLTIENFDRGDTLLAELILGRIVRFKFTFRGEDRYFNFSLMGATAAIMRADKMCREYQDIDPDKRYFDDDGTRKKSDEEYFEA
ncbi:MAG: hypothetical protein QF732_11895 [Nitrospinaceae bacterium]|jgi:hypothetical protein|nr:hypothetical protein [Nitrospinaceae bacterium]